MKTNTRFGVAARLSAVAATTAIVGAAQAQIIQPCTNFLNNNFLSGSAFWSVNIQSGGWGDSFGGVFASFAPLSIVPQPQQGNVATFFTEAFAAGDCEAPLGSAHNSQAILGRILTFVPSGGLLRFRFGAQLSFVLVNDARVDYSINLIVRNLTTGKEAKCKLESGFKFTTNGSAGEDIFKVNEFFNFYDPCKCPDLNGLYSTGNIIEILAIGTVQARATKMGDYAFIGGPIYWDDFQFCNILCPIFPDWPVPAEEAVELQIAAGFNPIDPAELLTSGNPYADIIALFDIDGDGVISADEWIARGFERVGPPPAHSIDPDINADGIVDQKDVDLIIAMINGSIRASTSADLNGDGIIDGRDLEILLDNLR